MAYFVNVILPIPLENLFTYQLTGEEAYVLQTGMRVAVPFGKSKVYTALVHQVHQTPPEAYEAREIHSILDTGPIVTARQLQHWEWMATYYMCTLGEVFRSAVPGALLLESETVILKNNTFIPDGHTLTEEEYLILEALENQAALRVGDAIAILEKKSVMPVLNGLLQINAIVLKEDLQELYKPKMVSFIKLAAEYGTEQNLEALLESLNRAPKQVQAVLALFQLQAQTKKPLRTKQLEKAGRISRAVVKALIDKGVFEEYEIRTDRVIFTTEGEMAPLKSLNELQKHALDTIQSNFKDKKVTLLHGVTSSGKTEVYVQLLESCLDTGRQALYLLPEIALTTQLIIRLQAYFGERISVYHSRYNVQERVEVWQNVLQKKSKAQLIIGARSALLLPYSDLGLIIIDEEHDGSYKQFDPAPRYHARDAAIMLGGIHHSNVLLGSATPSIETFFNVSTGKYGYARIERRFGNVLMPEMELVDLREQMRKKRMKGHFSERLQVAITKTLEAGEQVILFQNRRGYAPIVECTTCGHSPQCPNCDVSLTFHQHLREMRCHYCGYHTLLPEHCMACGNYTLDTKGFGTEQVEEELKALYPGVRTGRMDLDTTRGKYAYEKIIHAFEQQELDILVGTQMLTKGLDFRNVNLVGIMNADNLLNFPDFRAHERSFQLLTQVAGRAGRTQKRGMVIIQTYNPHHQILQQVTTGDFEGMYQEQVYEREQFGYPPINRLIRVTFKHKEYNRLNEAADWFGQALRNVIESGILGPEFPVIARIRNQYIKHILIKIPKGQSLPKTKYSIKRIHKSFHAISQYRSVRVIYNVDHL